MTVTGVVEGLDRVTVKVALVVPVLPSATVVSAIERLGFPVVACGMPSSRYNPHSRSCMDYQQAPTGPPARIPMPAVPAPAWAALGGGSGSTARLPPPVSSRHSRSPGPGPAAADSDRLLLAESSTSGWLELVTPDDLLPDADSWVVGEVSAPAELGFGFRVEEPFGTPDLEACRAEWAPADELPEEASPARLLADVPPLSAVVSACANPEPVARAAPTPRPSAPTPSQE